ncbi:MAG: universal stress protein [Spirosomaceae bacterium]|nr:universal stress protein [Spirosomataceae bacterium]
MKKILLTTDFSKASEKAIHYALNLFNDTQCEFTLMHAYDTIPAGPPESSFALIEDAYKTSKALLDKQLANIKKFDDEEYHTFKTELMPTSPSSAIQILNQRNNYDLVVVGASGRGDNIFFGSTATDVVRNAGLNSLVIPVNAKIESIKNIVFAVDYQPVSSFEIFEDLKDLTHRKDATITLLNILKDGQTPTDINGLMKFEYHDYFNDVKTNDYYVHEKNVEEGIADYLKYHNVDLLVMVSRHHSFFDVIFNRSVTRKFALHPTIPLLSIYDEVETFVPENEIIAF